MPTCHFSFGQLAVWDSGPRRFGPKMRALLPRPVGSPNRRKGPRLSATAARAVLKDTRSGLLAARPQLPISQLRSRPPVHCPHLKLINFLTVQKRGKWRDPAGSRAPELPQPIPKKQIWELPWAWNHPMNPGYLGARNWPHYVIMIKVTP